jgi:hypothetical protein
MVRAQTKRDNARKSGYFQRMAEDESTFSIAKLREMMRKFEELPQDEIAVSMLFPPDKVSVFTDDRGTVYAMGPALFQRLKAHAKENEAAPWQSNLALVSAYTHVCGIPFIFADEASPAAARVKQRIARALCSAIEVHDFMKRLGFQERLLRS